MGAFITNLGWVPSAWRRRLGLVCKEGATEGILWRDKKDSCYRKISSEAVCWVDWSGQTQTWRHLFRDCLVQHLHFISGETGAGGINHTPKATELADTRQDQNPGPLAASGDARPTAIRPCAVIGVLQGISGKS